MTIIEKSKLINQFIVIIPGLFIIGLGTLEINFPHAMDGFDDAYTGRGRSGFILLLFELLLMVTWGRIAGIILILLGIILILFGLFPSSSNKEETEKISETEQSNSET